MKHFKTHNKKRKIYDTNNSNIKNCQFIPTRLGCKIFGKACSDIIKSVSLISCLRGNFIYIKEKRSLITC